MKAQDTMVARLFGSVLLLALPACDGSEGDQHDQDGGNSNVNIAPDAGICGNSFADWNESCDGTDLRGKTCENLGWEGGDLGCRTDCHYLDASGCTGHPPCGNGQVDPEEQCDGDQFFEDLTCEAMSANGYAGPFVGGVLHCNDRCMIVMIGCVADSNCGNGVIDGREECDYGAQNSDTAVGGCRTNCRIASCGDGVNDENPNEPFCDDGLNNSDTEPDACRWDCRRARCGDGVKDTPEACDGDDLGGAACTTLGFQGGTLTCDSTCLLDTSDCTL